MKIALLLCMLAFMMTGCTYAITVVRAECTATDRVDEAPNPTQNTNVNVVVSGYPK